MYKRQGDNYALRILQSMAADTLAMYRALEQAAGTAEEEGPAGPSPEAGRGGKLKVVSKYGVDLTQKAREGKLDQMCIRDRGREAVMRRTRRWRGIR